MAQVQITRLSNEGVITHHQCTFTRVAIFFSFCDEQDLLKEKQISICSGALYSKRVLGRKQEKQQILITINYSGVHKVYNKKIYCNICKRTVRWI